MNSLLQLNKSIDRDWTYNMVDNLDLNFLSDGKVVCSLEGVSYTFSDLDSLSDESMLKRRDLISILKRSLHDHSSIEHVEEVLKRKIELLNSENVLTSKLNYEKKIDLAIRHVEAGSSKLDYESHKLRADFLERLYCISKELKNEVFFEDYNKYSINAEIKLFDDILDNPSQNGKFLDRLESTLVKLMFAVSDKNKFEELFSGLNKDVMDPQSGIAAYQAWLDSPKVKAVLNAVSGENTVLEQTTQRTSLLSRVPRDILPGIMDYAGVPPKPEG